MVLSRVVNVERLESPEVSGPRVVADLGLKVWSCGFEDVGHWRCWVEVSLGVTDRWRRLGLVVGRRGCGRAMPASCLGVGMRRAHVSSSAVGYAVGPSS